MSTIQLKRGQSTNFASVNLLAGEPAFTLDSGKLYIGDGTNKVLINPDSIPNADVATKLANSRIIAISGDAAGSANFDGSTNATITLVLANSGYRQELIQK